MEAGDSTAVVRGGQGGSNQSAMPTKEEWDQYRDAISRLYFVENQPLRKVRALMSERYGFRAT
jgi:hypothetical protein